MGHFVAPSILAADFNNLGRDIEVINNSDADWIHVDVMDGIFVPNISFGLPVLQAVKKIAKKPLDVHLMITDPDKYLEAFRDAGADNLTVHYETCPHLHRTVTRIGELGMKPGVTINPHTPVHVLEEIIEHVYMVLIMSVNPGFGAQKFIPQSLEKVKKLKSLITEKNADVLIEIDGGIHHGNVREVVNSGVDVVVAGNTVFGADDPKESIKKLKFL